MYGFTKILSTPLSYNKLFRFSSIGSSLKSPQIITGSSFSNNVRTLSLIE